MKPKILKETPISLVEVKNELENVKKIEKELTFRANKVEDYLNQFVDNDDKKILALKEKLEKMKIPRLREQYIIKIIDLLPKTVDELKVILQGYTVSISNDNMKKIIAAVKDAVGE